MVIGRLVNDGASLPTRRGGAVERVRAGVSESLEMANQNGIRVLIAIRSESGCPSLKKGRRFITLCQQCRSRSTLWIGSEVFTYFT